MLDKFTEKLVESAVSSYLPKLQEMSAGRVEELTRVRALVRSDPEQVEAWFDSEIARARNVDVHSVLEKIQK